MPTLEDFRAPGNIKDLENLSDYESDLRCLQAIFELLRAGNLKEAQSQLEQGNHFDKYLWLLGSQPMFDNIQYSETCEYLDLIPTDIIREQSLPKIQKSQEEYEIDNFVYGNRTNLMFVDSCFAHIESLQ